MDISPHPPAAPVQWRAGSLYTATSIATAGLVAESQLFLLTAASLNGAWAERAAETRRILVDGALPQRSRASRNTVAKRITERLIRWNPPGWVLDDLVAFAQAPALDSLKAALLVHTARQDFLLYSAVRHVVVPKWQSGEHHIAAADIHRFFDAEATAHPEVNDWAYATRNRLASNILSTLRDFGLLRGGRGTDAKTIAAPLAPPDVADHLLRLLAAEGFAAAEIPDHPDWQLWLWTRRQVMLQQASYEQAMQGPKT